MENEFLTDAVLEGDTLDALEETFIKTESAFADEPTKESKTENANSDESSPKTNENEQEPSQEGEPEKDNTPMEENVPFHKHPRFKEIIEDNKKLKEELEQTRTDVLRKLEEVKPQPTEQIPESFKKLYGDSPEVWNAWQEYLKEETVKIKDDIFSKIKAEAEAKIKEEQVKSQKEKETQEYFANQFNEIEATDGKIDRNAIVKILQEYHPIDPETSMYDIKAAYKIYKQINKPDTEKSNKRKAIADTTTSNGSSSSDEKKITWDSIRNKGWDIPRP